MDVAFNFGDYGAWYGGQIGAYFYFGAGCLIVSLLVGLVYKLTRRPRK